MFREQKKSEKQGPITPTKKVRKLLSKSKVDRKLNLRVPLLIFDVKTSFLKKESSAL